MPYEDNNQLPDAVKETLPSEVERDKFRGAFNACMYDGGTESKCYRIGYSASRKTKSVDLPTSRALVEAKRRLPSWAWSVLNRESFEVLGSPVAMSYREVLKAYSSSTVELLAGRTHNLTPSRHSLRSIIDSANDRELAKDAIGAAPLPGWVRATLLSSYCSDRLPVVFVGKSLDGDARKVLDDVYSVVLGCSYTVAEDPTSVDSSSSVLVAVGNGEHVNHCDARLPHPLALLAKGDRGEVVRKSRQINKLLDSTLLSVIEYQEISRINSESKPDGEDQSLSVQIQKEEKSLQVVTGIVLEPFGGSEREPDTQGDFVSAKEIETAAHRYLSKSRVVGLEHAKEAEGATVVESYLVPYPSVKDYRDAMHGLKHRSFKMSLGSGSVVSGSWVVSTKLPAELWEDYLEGRLTAYSMGGLGSRARHSGELPEVDFLEV